MATATAVQTVRALGAGANPFEDFEDCHFYFEIFS
jgi:hypothetical protein